MKRISLKRVGCLLGIVLVIVGFSSPCGRIPDEVLTGMSMRGVKSSVLEYCRLHDQPPESLDALDSVNGRQLKIKDEWRRRFDYSIIDGVVELRSLGSDRKVGGEGRRKDMVGTFPLKNSEGEWGDNLTGWIKHPALD